MRDLPLTYELALIIAIACLVSWLMGRALCKSKEHIEREAKKALEREKHHLQSLLEKKDTEMYQVSDQLNDEKSTVNALQQQQKNSDVAFTKLQQELATLEKNQHDLEVTLQQQKESSEIALNKLQQELATSEKNRHDLEVTLQQQKESSDTALNELQQELATSEKNQHELETSSHQQQETIDQLKHQHLHLEAINEDQSKALELMSEKIDSYLENAHSANLKIAHMLETFPTEETI